MAWVRIDDGFAQHPKVVGAGPLAIALHVAALCYCNRNLTDGFVPRAVARTLLDWEIVDSSGIIHTLAVTSGMSGNDVTSAFVISLLLDAGMWIESDRGYEIHDYLQYQPSSQDVKEQREKTKVRVNQWRSKKKQEQSNGHCNGVTNDVSNVHVTPAPVPVPFKKETPIAPKGAGDRFEEFWSTYPHRGKHQDPKKPAQDKWERKVRGGADPAEIIAGAKAYADTVRSERIEPQHVAQAVTWLNQERWADCKEPELTQEEIAALRSVRGEDDLELPAFLDRRARA